MNAEPRMEPAEKRAPKEGEHETRIEYMRTAFARGETVHQVAATLGLSPTTVYRIVQANPDLQIPKSRKTIRGLIHKNGIGLGSIDKAMSVEEEDVIQWIVAQVPLGGNLAEFLVSCAVDAYHDEMSSGRERHPEEDL